MIYEYALEPELVATWKDRHNFCYFIEKFGLGQSRLVSRYPKPWKKLVWVAFQGGDGLERKRMEELIVRLAERMIVRKNYVWDSASPWLINTEHEHRRCPFQAILALTNPNGSEHVLLGNDLLTSTSPLWDIPRGLPVARNAQKMADAVCSMLRCATMVIFVDPSFGPENPRHRRPLEAFLRVLMRDRTGTAPVRIEVHTSVKSTVDFFKTTCERELPRIIPTGLHVVFKRWKQKPEGEKLHNRYILTDLGGVIFNIGLDDGGGGETDDITLMDKGQYSLRWQQYAGDVPAFDLSEDPVVVVGR